MKSTEIIAPPRNYFFQLINIPELLTTVPYIRNPCTKANQAFLNVRSPEVQKTESKVHKTITQYKDKYKTYLPQDAIAAPALAILSQNPRGSGHLWPEKYGRLYPPCLISLILAHQAYSPGQDGTVPAGHDSHRHGRR
ncbi:MAG: hypothetical protein CVV64_18500 [Candidatus Wallbacteria bacterium HGW-Wallbacteria-1]|uniref:Uncharacterized protein n=1 Tax=Candidatus Wallbacteria bacterium HGW-Wallbacteria-1 TaxID=2013854 RepID=A0A2N1PJH6_9BACT|nr:MAG: hypothetical protein CVV64_18500 [Candidatus Wallbacteria bacterium HGW-Wallbacteria-1]